MVDTRAVSALWHECSHGSGKAEYLLWASMFELWLRYAKSNLTQRTPVKRNGRPKIRVALIGCGSIRAVYAPVLAGHPSRLRAMVDTNPVWRGIWQLYRVPTVLASARDLSRDLVDAAVVAVPSALHAEVTLPLLETGLHVLVEKPIASTRKGATNMVQAAERHGVVLAVGHFRRMFPATRLMAALLRTRAYGRVLSFTAEEGHLFDWPSATLALMRRDLAGGGVLMDMGCHVLDQLMLMLPGTVSVTHYADNPRSMNRCHPTVAGPA